MQLFILFVLNTDCFSFASSTLSSFRISDWSLCSYIKLSYSELWIRLLSCMWSNLKSPFPGISIFDMTESSLLLSVKSMGQIDSAAAEIPVGNFWQMATGKCHCTSWMN